MGSIEMVMCKKCLNTWQCKIGSGMMHGRFETILELYPKDMQTRIEEKVGQELFPVYDFAYKIWVCEDCKSIVSVPVLCLKSKYTFVGKCEKCHGDTVVESDLENLHCPACGEQSWEQIPFGLWD